MKGFISPLWKSRRVWSFAGFGQYGRCDDCGARYKRVGRMWLVGDKQLSAVCPRCCPQNLYRCVVIRDFLPVDDIVVPWYYMVEVIAPSHDGAMTKFKELCVKEGRGDLLACPVDVSLKHVDILAKNYTHCGEFLRVPITE